MPSNNQAYNTKNSPQHMSSKMSSASRISLISVMLAFFTMGFVDLVGIASNYVKSDLHLSDSVANIMPSLVFFWFLVFAVPTGMLMNRIGRRRTVLLSIAVTLLSLLLAMVGSSFPLMLCAFSLLGIGNALMQTSLNPLVATVVKGGNLASTLTFGQFVKAIASFLAPYIAVWGATAQLPTFGLGWKVLFPIYAVVAITALLLLASTPIDEGEPSAQRATGFVDCVRLLRRPLVLLSFIGIVCHVGIDVGTNATAPKILMERLGMGLHEAAFATSLYFAFRTIGSLTGSMLLRVVKARIFFALSVVMMLASMAGMAWGESPAVLYTAIALVGYGNSNIFPMIFAEALRSDSEHANEVSGLMVMGLAGGAVFPLVMGLASDAVGQIGAVAVMAVGVCYLLTYIRRIS